MLERADFTLVHQGGEVYEKRKRRSYHVASPEGTLPYLAPC
jgi:hypothetical protein